ncbi:PREDICTED: uncharacterized protein At1g24010-like [Camelina sativa]|uniref:Uncharacterized protein At1g24010-like n=1 Tax=Camelina sativa TaxID=90675 RepID=A0ABM0YCF5_CAMSA|nr:PREDICTED: uncharacterized protein At1g24010-like [Camelina sativa]
MTLNGYLSTDFYIKSPANEFFQTCINILDLPKGNVTEEIEALPSEKKKTTFRIEGFQVSEWYESLEGNVSHSVSTWQNLDGYKKLEGTMTIIHVEDNNRSRGIFTVKYEKISSNIEDPKSIVNTFVDFFTEMDAYLLETIN